MTDWRFALRRLLRSPGFTLFGVATLALGIGATTAFYSLVHGVLGPAPGVPNINRIVNVYAGPAGAPVFAGLSKPDYEAFRARQHVFDLTTAWAWFGAAYSANGESATSFGEMVGGDYFTLLGVVPTQGRLLQPADDGPTAAPVAVVSRSTWHRLFGRDDFVPGQVIKINGHTFDIVGVAPATFRGLFNNGLTPTALWVPVSSAAAVYRRSPGITFDPSDPELRFLLVKGLLKPGRTIDDARAELSALDNQISRAHPPRAETNPADVRGQRPQPWQAQAMADTTINESTGGLASALMAALMLSVAMVLLVACSNLANLMLARGSGRVQELAVRLSLGASRLRVIRESISECLILGGVGGVAGLGVAVVLIRILSRDVPVAGTFGIIHIEPALDLSALAVAAGATFLALFVTAIGPALRSTRVDVRSTLAGGGQSGPTARWRGRRYLISAQITAAVTLLAVAGIASSQLRSIKTLDYGFELNQLAAAVVDFEAQHYDQARADQIVQRFLSSTSNGEHITAVSVANGLPMGQSSLLRGRLMAGDDSRPRYAEVIAGTPALLRSFGLRLVAGRDWEREADPAGRVTVIDAWTAQSLFGTTQAVGREMSLQLGDASARMVRIIGVAGDIYRPPARGSRSTGQVYVPFDHDYGSRLVFTVRTAGDPEAAAGFIRQTLRSIDAGLVVQNVGTGPQVTGSNTQFFEISAALASLLGFFAWVLALIGLYGVLSDLVLRRTREIGIRLALGASRKAVTRMMVFEGLGPVAFGLVIGSLLAWMTSRALLSRFLQFQPALDDVALWTIPAVLIAAAIFACYAPARRAAGLDPMNALRRE